MVNKEIKTVAPTNYTTAANKRKSRGTPPILAPYTFVSLNCLKQRLQLIPIKQCSAEKLGKKATQQASWLMTNPGSPYQYTQIPTRKLKNSNSQAMPNSDPQYNTQTQLQICRNSAKPR